MHDRLFDCRAGRGGQSEQSLPLADERHGNPLVLKLSKHKRMRYCSDAVLMSPSFLPQITVLLLPKTKPPLSSIEGDLIPDNIVDTGS
jgi:hypothetical protein